MFGAVTDHDFASGQRLVNPQRRPPRELRERGSLTVMFEFLAEQVVERLRRAVPQDLPKPLRPNVPHKRTALWLKKVIL